MNCPTSILPVHWNLGRHFQWSEPPPKKKKKTTTTTKQNKTKTKQKKKKPTAGEADTSPDTTGAILQRSQFSGTISSRTDSLSLRSLASPLASPPPHHVLTASPSKLKHKKLTLVPQRAASFQFKRGSSFGAVKPLNRSTERVSWRLHGWLTLTKVSFYESAGFNHVRKRAHPILLSPLFSRVPA